MLEQMVLNGESQKHIFPSPRNPPVQLVSLWLFTLPHQYASNSQSGAKAVFIDLYLAGTEDFNNSLCGEYTANASVPTAARAVLISFIL